MKQCFLVCILFYILCSQGPPAVAQSNGLLLEITLLPNFATRSITVTGRFQEASCSTIRGLNLKWFAQATPLIDDLASEKEVICPFILTNFGSVVPDKDSKYWLKLHDFNLPSEEDSLDFSVVNADVLAYRFSTQEDTLPLTRSDWLWHVDGPLGELHIQIHPWTLDTTLSLTPLLSGPFQSRLNVSFLVSGKAFISGIEDADSYHAMVGRSTLSSPSGNDLLMSYLDYPPALYADIFPGLDDIYLSYRANTRDFSALFLQGTIVSHSAPTTDAGASMLFSFVGVNHPFGENGTVTKACAETSLRASSDDYQPQDDELKLSLCTRLGPEDTLTLQLRNALIVHTSLPPNQRPAPDTVVYQGGGWFQIDIYYLPFTVLYLQQAPFTLRVMSNSVENGFAMMAQQSPFVFTILAFVIFIGLFSLLNYWPGWRPLKPVILLGAGIALLYWTQSAANLLCLSLIAAPFPLGLRHFPNSPRRERFLISVGVILLILENYFALNDQGLFAIKPTSINIHHTPLLIFIALLLIGIYAYDLWRNSPQRQATIAYYTDIKWLPAYATFLMIVVTYDVIDRSLISLLLIILTISLISWRVRSRENTSSETDSNRLTHVLVNEPAESIEASPKADDWSRHLKAVIKNPAIVVFISVLTLLVIGSGTNSLNGIFFTLVTIIGSLLLFTILYDYIPGGRGYIRAFVFPIPLMMIFFMGIGTAAVPLQAPGSMAVTGPATRYSLFMDQFPALFVGRIIFYVSVPMLISLYLDYVERKKGNDESLFKDPQRFFAYGSALLSILLPSLYNILSATPALTTFADLVQRILTLTEGGT